MEWFNVSCTVIHTVNTWMNNSFTSLSVTEEDGANLSLTCRACNRYTDWYRNGEVLFQTSVFNNDCKITPKSNEYYDFSRKTSLSCDGTVYNVTLRFSNGTTTRTDWQCGLETSRSNIITIGGDLPESRTGITLIIAGSAAGPVCICIVVVVWTLRRRRSSWVGSRKLMGNICNAATPETDSEEIEMVDNLCYAGVARNDPEQKKSETSLTIP